MRWLSGSHLCIISFNLEWLLVFPLCLMTLTSEAYRPLILQSVPCYGCVCFLPFRVRSCLGAVALRRWGASFLVRPGGQHAAPACLALADADFGSAGGHQVSAPRSWAPRCVVSRSPVQGRSLPPGMAATWICCHSDSHEMAILFLTRLCPAPSVVDVLLAGAFILLAFVFLWVESGPQARRSAASRFPPRLELLYFLKEGLCLPV